MIGTGGMIALAMVVSAISYQAKVMTGADIGGATGTYMGFATMCGYQYGRGLESEWQDFLRRAPEQERGAALASYREQYDWIMYLNSRTEDYRSEHCRVKEEAYSDTIGRWENFLKTYKGPIVAK